MKPYYQDEYCEIYNCDCRSVLPLISADLVITDPPYGLGFEYLSFEDTQENLKQSLSEVMPMILKFKRVMLTPGHTNIWHYPPSKWVMAWVYGTTNARNSWGFTSWQPILCYGKDPYLENGLGARMDIIQDSKVPEENGHPCPKPISFVSKLINRGSAKISDIVLDPFMGSGTTLLAAKNSGRKSIGIEIEKKYCDIAIERMSQYRINFGEDARAENQGSCQNIAQQAAAVNGEAPLPASAA